MGRAVPSGRDRRWTPPAAAGAAQWIVLVTGVVVAVSLLSGDGAAGQVDEDDLRRGGELYATNCAACHGSVGQGGHGEGLLAGPPVDDVDVAYADLVIRTGRMPIVTREAGLVRDPDLDDNDRAQIVAWMTEVFDLAGEVPDVPEGDPTRGRILFNEHCAACHGTTGTGGVAGGGVTILPARGVDRVATFSAARVGPFEMPSFGPRLLPDDDLADIATAIQEMDRERPSPLAITDVTHVTGTVFAAVAVAVLVGLAWLVAKLPRIRIASEQEFDLDEEEGS